MATSSLKHEQSGSADVLKPAAQSPAFNVLTAFKDCPIVAPEVVRDWLSETTAMFEAAVLDLHSRRESIGEGKDSDKLQAASIVLNSLDFLDIAERTEPLAQDDMPVAVSQALVNGIRLGLLYQNLNTLAHDRYKAKWRRDEVLEAARDAKAEQQRGPSGAEERQRTAREKWAQVKKTMPTRTATVQKTQAAKELGISLRQFNRWLNPPQK
jgi:hypothetical protein